MYLPLVSLWPRKCKLPVNNDLVPSSSAGRVVEINVYFVLFLVLMFRLDQSCLDVPPRTT